MRKSITILRDEHRSIAAVLQGLQQLTREAQEATARPSFEALRAMIYYIEAFPEREHHPKEDAHLFARLAERFPDALPLIRQLRAEHVAGGKAIRDLEHRLLAFEQNWPRGADRFGAAVDAYVQFHWNHMRREERELLPLAERAFTVEDWQAIDNAFAKNADPLAGAETAVDFEALIARIMSLAPEPIGLGTRGARD